jgi:chromosome segregation ATPase
MKKSKVYLIIPIIVLGVFYGYYWNFSSQYEAKQAAVVQAEKERKLERLKAEAVSREAAIHDAIEAQKQRKADRIAREEKERQMKDAKENAHLEADKALQEEQKLQRQEEKLEKDVGTAKEEIAKLETELAHSTQELGFIKEYTEAAVANQAKLSAVVTKIAAADAAAAKAAALAAAQAALKK